METSKPQIGIVLSGGGVRGIAHIGLIQALQESGIVPTYVAGASAGALVGAFYAAGYEAEDILNFFHSTPLFRFSLYAAKKPGLINSEKFRRYLDRYFPVDSFEALSKPLFITATDIGEGIARIFSKGDLVKPILASCAIPPVFSPLEINGTLYSDGGIMNNFPVEPLQPLCTHLIGSYASPVQKMDCKKLSNSLKVLNRAYELRMYTDNKNKFHHCDFVLEPKALRKVGFLDTRAINKAYEIGYEAAKAQIDVIQERLFSKRCKSSSIRQAS